MELQIERMDGNLISRLRQARELGVVGNVVNIFNTVINIELINPSLLITLSKKDVTSAPYMMKAFSDAEFDKLKEKLDIGDTFRFKTDGEMTINDDKVIYNASKMFSSLIEPVHFEKNDLQSKKTEVDSYLETKGNYGGLLNAYLNQIQKENHLSVSLSIYDNYFQQLLKQLANNFSGENLKQFIGLGVGLTPSGDDFIVGLLSVLSRYDASGQWLNEIRSEFKDSTIDKKTTRVSSHMIHYALDGYFNSALIELVCGKKAENLEIVSSIGSTSGTDMLTGVGFGLDRLIKSQKERVI